MMNSFYLRAGAALACAVTLSACGGSDGELLLGGSFGGVTKAGLVLTNGDQRFEVPASTAGNGTGTFFFTDLVSTDDEYDVKVASIPDNVEKCEVVNGKGRAAFNITTVQVICEFKRHELKGSIANLKGAGLVLVNGADRVEVGAGATTFTMAKVPEDGVYGVAILQQPANQTCTIANANASGTMGKNDITNVNVTCAP
jgi:hypothetical protein